MLRAFASLLAAAALPAFATTETLVPDLEQRFASGGAARVNAYLASNWSTAMVPFNRKTEECELRAVSLAIRLNRGADAKTGRAHSDSLREAVGHCTTYVLAFATAQEIPKYCSSVASWTVMQTVREL